ncbi:MAG TPA: DUF2855 family protein, partial [Ilumatobacter sp.]|nr:DUF2855 family protein [Ilumatobacter sp.]
EPAELGEGQVRLRVRSFGLTANNVTYAAAGDLLGYWTFFPAPDLGDEVPWGRVPVWGFADVVESRCDGVVEGERVFGYLPMSTELVIEPARITEGSLVDSSAQRAALPVVYNHYTRCAADPGYSPDAEAEQMRYRPLFVTSFLIDDALDDNDVFGAGTVVLGSASSKTAFGTAFLLRRREAVQVLGLTSAANAAFVRSLGCYDGVFTYDEVDDLPDGRVVFVDMSGSADVVRRVHERYGDDLTHSMVVGITHWEDRGAPVGVLPGPAPALFFAPSQIEKRRADWGPGGVEERLAAAWTPFIEFVGDLVRIEHGDGPDAVVQVFGDLVENRTPPDVAHVLHP